MGAAVLYMSTSVDDVLPSRIELEIVRVIDTPEATHLRYRGTPLTRSTPGHRARTSGPGVPRLQRWALIALSGGCRDPSVDRPERTRKGIG
jgi:hypothetical protein